MRIADESAGRLAALIRAIRDQLGLGPDDLRFDDLRFDALRVVEDDPEQTRGVEGRLGLNEGSLQPGGMVAVRFHLFGKALYVGFPIELDPEEAAARLASEIQDQVLEELRGEPRPACPGHQHPMSARVHGGVAVWACPYRGQSTAPIRARSTG